MITLPENVNTDRKEITPTYNRAGALEKVSYDGTEYVENIAYNAKGQRLLIAFGNDIMTRYVYDNRTFRLLRQRSEKYAKTHVGNTITYTPQSGTNRQDDGFNFDLVGNILKILHRVNDCGISGSPLGSDALDREFEYDPLYRVVSANGRESDTQDQNDYLYSDAPIPGSPNANNVRAYTRQYSYDRLGNIQQLKQLGTNGFTRNFVYNMGGNTLQKIETPAPSLIENFTYDNCGNQLTAGTTRNYVWNAGNQLITYYNQAGSADPTIFAQYDYSGMNRVSKMVRTGTAGSPIYERTIYIDGIFEYHILENGTTYEKNYVHIMDDQSRIAMVRIGTPFPDDIADAITYNLEDQIGSSTMRLNSVGGVIDKEEYYPFGDSSLRTFTKKRYRYVGKEKDLESGLYYYGARYYAAWTCRFISVDPLAADYPFYTPYNYAGNKPVNKVDIDGMQEEGAETAPTNGNQSKSNDIKVNKISKEERKKNRQERRAKIKEIKKSYNEAKKNLSNSKKGFINLSNKKRYIEAQKYADDNDGTVTEHLAKGGRKFYSVNTSEMEEDKSVTIIHKFFNFEKYQKYKFDNYAQLLLNSDNVTFANVHPSGVKDNATAQHNIEDAAAGRKVSLSNYGNAPGGTVDLNPKLLEGLYILSLKYKFTVSELAGASHSVGSEHYKGNSVDINWLNDIHVGATHPDAKAFIKDAKKLGFKVNNEWKLAKGAHFHMTMSR